MASLTLEAMFAFLALLALISSLGGEMMAQAHDAQERAEGVGGKMGAEAAARAVEAMLNSGADLRFDFRSEGVRYSLENGRFHVLYGDKVIEVEGVYADDDSEPL